MTFGNISTYVPVRSWPRGLPPAEISQTSENCGRIPVALYHCPTNCSVHTERRHRYQHRDQQQHRRSLYEILFDGGKLRRRLADAVRAESWGSEVENGNASSEIGGLKALASHGSEGSSRERALARSLASSIYIYISKMVTFINMVITRIKDGSPDMILTAFDGKLFTLRASRRGHRGRGKVAC